MTAEAPQDGSAGVAVVAIAGGDVFVMAASDTISTDKTMGKGNPWAAKDALRIAELLRFVAWALARDKFAAGMTAWKIVGDKAALINGPTLPAAEYIADKTRV